MEELWVHCDPAFDWSPLSNLKKLRSLSQGAFLDDWNESSMRALQTLPLLTHLRWPTKLSSEFPLPQVKEMNIFIRGPATQVLDASCCVEVEKLTVSGPINVASVAHCFPNIKQLDYGSDPSIHRVDARPLGDLLKLEDLRVPLGCAEYGDFSFLAGLVNLQRLDLRHLLIADLSVLRNMTNLRSLTLSETRAEDISVLAGLKRLRMLDLRDTRVCAVSYLRGHPSLA